MNTDTPSLISLVVSVDVKHHVYLLTYTVSDSSFWQVYTMYTF